MYNNVMVEIVEQPHPNSMRFRYSSEGKTAGSIVGADSTEENKTFPSIRVLNYDGTAQVCVSCVSIDEVPKPHPNCLVGKECNQGLRSFYFTTSAASPRVLRFPNLGIQCPKSNEIEARLKQRQQLRIDPFNTGFEHMDKPKEIELHQMRLCFQVFLLPNPTDKKNVIPIRPVVTDIISNKQKNYTALRIYDTSDNSSPASGNKKIMILCDKVDKADIRIPFYEKDANGSVVWQACAKLTPRCVHRQVGVVFRTPRYVNQKITEPVKVFFHIERKVGSARSEPVPFEYVPDKIDVELAKRAKIDNATALYEFLQANQNIPPDTLVDTSNFNMQSTPVQPHQLQYSNHQQQQQYNQTMHRQFNVESNHENLLSSTFGNVTGANATNLNSNNFSNSRRPGHSHRNNQPISFVGNNPHSMNYGTHTHCSCQPMGPIYTTDKVIIQHFCNNNVTVNQPQSVANVMDGKFLQN